MVEQVRSLGSSPFRLVRATSPDDEREGRMPAPPLPLTGDALLAAVTKAMVACHERYHHRAPVTAKTLLLGGELLVCVLGGVYTDVEKTMLELQRAPIVHETAAPSRTRWNTGSSLPSNAYQAARC
jgi:hypothetical protein